MQYVILTNIFAMSLSGEMKLFKLMFLEFEKLFVNFVETRFFLRIQRRNKCTQGNWCIYCSKIHRQLNLNLLWHGFG